MPVSSGCWHFGFGVTYYSSVDFYMGGRYRQSRYFKHVESFSGYYKYDKALGLYHSEEVLLPTTLPTQLPQKRLLQMTTVTPLQMSPSKSLYELNSTNVTIEKSPALGKRSLFYFSYKHILINWQEDCHHFFSIIFFLFMY